MTPTPELEKFVKDRLNAMYDHPLTWAFTTEGFGLQCVLLGEVMGMDTRSLMLGVLAQIPVLPEQSQLTKTGPDGRSSLFANICGRNR